MVVEFATKSKVTGFVFVQFVMGEETSHTMNLDLNLGPDPEPVSGSLPNEPVTLDQWIEERVPASRYREALPANRYREAFRFRGRRLWRRRQLQIPPEARTISMELSQMLVNSSDGNALHAGEGSVTAEERSIKPPKTCELGNVKVGDGTEENKGDAEKGGGNDGSFFDCNICLDLARDPVVTCCGHLFCWPCIYRWIHLHSIAKECPVCKGEVTMKNVTPIYGRGKSTQVLEEDVALKIPQRPHARRVEGQSIPRRAFTFTMEEMIRRLGNRFDLTPELAEMPEANSSRETSGRAHTWLSRILTSRGMRREQEVLSQTEELGDLTPGMPEAAESHRIQPLFLRRTQSHRTGLSSISSAYGATERSVQTNLATHSLLRNQEQPLPVDDRDSFSSIAAVINSGSQMDTAVEIDSMVSLSTSSSGRRNDIPRGSDMDSGDSRPHRRRRIN